MFKDEQVGKLQADLRLMQKKLEQSEQLASQAGHPDGRDSSETIQEKYLRKHAPGKAGGSSSRRNQVQAKLSLSQVCVGVVPISHTLDAQSLVQ